MQLIAPGQTSPGVQSCLGRWLRTYDAECRHGRSLLVAVSGGSDSLALLFALSEFGRELPCELRAVTIDHALRPEAADEARRVAEICAGLNIPHHSIRLDWPNDMAVSQAKARQARYSKIAELCHKIDARIVLTGHTLDDQLETILMRRSSGSDHWGLAGMADLAPMPIWPLGAGLLIGRPVLSQRREELRGYLTERGQTWVDDPSNSMTRYERVRARQTIAAQPSLRDELRDLLLTSSQLRQAQCDRLTRWCASALHWLPGGAASFSETDLADLSPEDQKRLFQLLLMCVSGSQSGVEIFRIESLLSDVSLPKGVTLGGCQIRVDGGVFRVFPEVAAQPEVTEISEESLIWDGRIRLAGERARLRSLEWVCWGERPVPSHYRSPSLPDFNVRKALPVGISPGGELVCVPHLDDCSKILAQDLGTTRLAELFCHRTEVFPGETRL